MHSSFRRAGTVLALLAALACGSGNSATPPTTSPTTTVASGPTPPVGAPGCALGYGSGRFTCQGDIPGLLPQLDAAINKLIAQKPQLFNLNDPAAAGAYQIYNVDAFYAGVIDNLTAAGMCGEVGYFKENIWIKENNSYSENYDIVTAQNFIRRGPKSYLGTCTPANFPLTPETAVARVSVSFFRIANCPPGTTIPLLGLNKLPIGCVATITATPRDAVGNKLPLDLHGTDVKWFFQLGESYVVSASPDAETVFNVRLTGNNAGEFNICATIQGKTGCMTGTVIE
jgi:hypothetical protein